MFLGKEEGDTGGKSTYWHPPASLRALMSKGLQKLYPEITHEKKTPSM